MASRELEREGPFPSSMKHTRKNKKRRPYSGSKVVDKTCRNRGSCAWCRSNRLHARKRQELRASP